MMSAAEYRAEAECARNRAKAVNDPGLRAEILDHARRWDRLASDAEVQDALVMLLASMPSATVQ